LATLSHSFLFTENKTKAAHTKVQGRQSPVTYNSTLSAKRNPDLLCGGGRFLKGNHYFMESPSSSSGDDEDGELIEQSEVPKKAAQEGELDLR
jgi:predicted NAD-dependent protein-ADP-ribosyltransferase YbiA (DUF1768 family)